VPIRSCIFLSLRQQKEGRNPNPVFDSRWYLATYSDVTEAEINPLVHYISSGASEGTATRGRIFDSLWYQTRLPTFERQQKLTRPRFRSS